MRKNQKVVVGQLVRTNGKRDEFPHMTVSPGEVVDYHPEFHVGLDVSVPPGALVMIVIPNFEYDGFRREDEHIGLFEDKFIHVANIDIEKVL